MSAVPAKCLKCKQDLRYDPINLLYSCRLCEAGAIVDTSTWRKRGQVVGRESARLVSKVERWLRK